MRPRALTLSRYALHSFAGKCEWLDNKHVVFGRVLEGMLAVRRCEAIAVNPSTSKPRLPIVIVQCGEM